MAGDVIQIAKRIREIRELNGVSPESLAKDCGVSPEVFRQYESGEADIPIGCLIRIAGRFRIELTALISGEEPRLQMFQVVRKGEGLSVERRKEYKYQDLAFNFRHKKLETFLVTVDPANLAGSAVRHYSHPGQEFNYVLEGSLKVVIQGHEVILEAGDSIFFDSGYEHAMSAQNGQPARFLAVVI